MYNNDMFSSLFDGDIDAGVHITATDDVMVYAVNAGSYMLTSLPVRALGTEYLVSCVPGGDVGLCQLGLVGVTDNTRVTLTWPGSNQHNLSLPVTDVILHSHQSMQLPVMTHHRGLKVTASAPLALFSGVQVPSTKENGELTLSVREPSLYVRI